MKKLSVLFIAFFAISCGNNDSDNPTSKTSLSLATGVNFRQNFDDAVLQLGNPNTLVNGKFVLYPNPAIETIFIQSEENISDVWIIPANPEKIYQDVNFNSVLNTNLYSEQSIAANSSRSLTGQSSNSITMDIGTLDQGYYRVFVKTGGEIYWDNLYKRGEGSNEEHINSIISFWN